MRDMPTDRGSWRRLALQVVEERAAHGWTQADVADRGGFSVDRLQEIEKGDSDKYRPTTLGALERGLRWRPGSVRRVLEGSEPDREREEEKPVPDVTQPPDAVDVDLTATTPETVDAIRRDPRLMEEARRHLLRQYEMLAQLSDLVGSNEVTKDARPETPVVPASPTQRPLRAVARKRPSPRRDKP